MDINFLKVQATVVMLLALSLFSCGELKKKEVANKELDASSANNTSFKISLAQWSLHKKIHSKELSPFDFAKEAKILGFEAIEYVSALYNGAIKDIGMDAVIDSLKTESEAHGVKNLLIMVDGEGNLASSSVEERHKAVENHKKWVDAAVALGCHSIRVNAKGDGGYEAQREQAVSGLSQLATYAKEKNINVIVENHGGLTSNGSWLAEVMLKINMSNCGTLPDFGNFCMKGNVHNCEDAYDRYKGVKELMPFAKAVSAKSYDFDANGNETKIDFDKMLKIIKDAGYSGYIGVEYEGSRLNEVDGILATKALLEKLINN
ncbi:sugar phosphate isomerase/epimerase family protein [Aestuariibaculum sediminum]|uniref:Sugar phosphate isomerase/epimerase n=1 Tax=Aestuariibaculum sediminum TaxID=2770637 RepID=A0A8J6Q1D7_9FLAO|nr:sugar phosphate isomerase/epimerase family protein [Aestuariibaculum sediminum]MBD0832942.1 sugar phosphate isomerase/epimerase [Aestuariibaculum sediminum]